MNRSLLIVFVKNPVPGKVKTRLSEEIGNAKATAIYLRCLRILREQILPLDCDIWISFGGGIGDDTIWNSPRFKRRTQIEGDLGLKMYDDMREAFKLGYKQVCLIGSDIPELNKEIIDQAFSHCGQEGVVLGPCYDGGYYLVGFGEGKLKGDYFQGITWSGSDVFNSTSSKITRHGQAFAKLPILRDIDTKEDLPDGWL